jgi:hypothetical protein
VIITFSSGLLPPFSLLIGYFAAVPLYGVGFYCGLKYALISASIAHLMHVALTGSAGLGFGVFTLVPLAAFFYWYEAPSDVKRTSRFGWYALIYRLLVLELIIMLGGLGLMLLSGIDPVAWFTKIFGVFAAQADVVIRHVVVLFPGFMLISWLCMTCMSAHLAYTLTSRQGKALYKIPHSFNMPLYGDIGLVVGVLVFLVARWRGSLMLEAVGVMLVMAACVPLALVGLRILFMWGQSRGMQPTHFWFWLFFSFVLAWPFVFIVVLGFAEPWYALSKRVQKNTKNR